MHTENIQSRLQFFDYLFIAGAPLLATLYLYSFGSGDHIEILPLLKRSINPDFLNHDFFLNAFEGRHPRYFFMQIMAFLSGYIKIPFLFFILSYLSNVFLAWITYRFVQWISRGNRLPILLAITLVLGLHTVEAGHVALLSSAMLTPHSLIMPLLLSASYLLFRCRLYEAMILTALASLIHPLLGMGYSGIFLASAFFKRIFFYDEEDSRNNFKWRNLFVNLLIFIAMAVFHRVFMEEDYWVRDKNFVDIFGIFRFPHHTLPSGWHWTEFLKMVSLLAAGIMAASRIQVFESVHRKHVFQFFLIISLIILLLCTATFIFTYRHISPLWISLQAFRFFDLIQWLSLIFIGAYLARKIEDALFRNDIQVNIIRLLALWNLPATAFMIFWDGWLLKAEYNRRKKYLLYLVPGILILFFLFLMPLHKDHLFLFLLLLFFCFLFYFFRFPVILLSILLFIGLLKGIDYYELEHKLPEPLIIKMKQFTDPPLDTDKAGDPYAVLCAFVKKNTPKDAIILTTPNGGRMRFMGERAIVVDFKAFPFSGKAMQAWKNRLDFCYGTTEKTGFDAAEALENNFRNITDEKILQIKKSYGASYAVLYHTTNTDFEVIYQNNHFKIVQL
jgi:hypothetical protein